MLKELMVLAIAASVASFSFAETPAPASGAPVAEKAMTPTKASAKKAGKHKQRKHIKKSRHHKSAAKAGASATK